MRARELPYRSGSSDQDVLAFERLLVSSFSFPAASAGPWIRRVGVSNLRFLGEDARSAPAGLALLRMGQFFGGRRVACAGIAAVGVLPDRRGQGLGGELMRAVVRELAAEGVALSCLYPATLPLYRGVGYEIAGGRHRMRVAPSVLDGPPGELEISSIPDLEAPAWRACAARVAERSNGHLDRPEPLWARVAEHRGERRDGFAACDSEGVVHGYVWYARVPRPDTLQHDLAASDLAVLDRDGADAIAAFLARHRSMVREVVWYGGPHDPFRDHLREVGATSALADPWMIRVIDVERALAARGYPIGLAIDVDLEIDDPLVPANHGRFRLAVRDGTAQVTRGGNGRVRLGISDLAPIFTGYATPELRARFGTARGAPEDLARLASVFAGPAPGMPDMF